MTVLAWTPTWTPSWRRGACVVAELDVDSVLWLS